VHSSSRFAFLQLIVHEQEFGSYTSQRSNRVRAQLTSVEDGISGPSNRMVRHLLWEPCSFNLEKTFCRDTRLSGLG
jgi:hypothetical protein